HRDAGGVEARGPPRGVPPDGVGTPHDEPGHPRGPHERGHRRPLLAVPPHARLERHVQGALGYQAAEVPVGRPRHAPLPEGHGLDARVGQGVLDGVPVVVGPSPPEDLRWGRAMYCVREVAKWRVGFEDDVRCGMRRRQPGSQVSRLVRLFSLRSSRASDIGASPCRPSTPGPPRRSAGGTARLRYRYLTSAGCQEATEAVEAKMSFGDG
ncbi:hypothetical protein THAOC_18208, partial [Thalassiosira oceanica]